MKRTLRIELTAREWTLRRPWRSATGTWTTRRGIVVRLDDGALAGLGEASPLPGYSPDTLDEVERALRRVAERPMTIDDDDAPLDVVRGALRELTVSPPAAAFAIETALLDLLARRRETSVFRLLGGGEATVPISGVVVGDDPPALLASCRALVARGIGTAKMKIGVRPFDLELAALRAIRDELGASLQLRLDANGAFTVERARFVLESVASLAPELVEEPVAPDSWGELRAPAVPLAMDESLQGPSGEARLGAALRDGRCRAVVLKPTVLGGALRCLELARLAAEHGARALVTHTVEGPIAVAATAHLALALANPLACGIDAAELDERCARHALFRGAHVVPADVIGLGIGGT